MLIGAGHLASHIIHFISSNNTLKLLQVFNHRKTKEALFLAQQNHCEFTTKYIEIVTNADIYVICVNDSSIKKVAKNLIPLRLKNLVVHTSGSIGMSALKNVSKDIGVFYPLQTFTKNDLIDWKMTPILLEANTNVAYTKLKMLAHQFSSTIKKVNSSKRLNIHLAAVFGCNFTNALYAISYQLFEKSLSKKNLKLLFPILKQSFNKAQLINPLDAQTGPARRNDQITMEKHLKLLRSNKQLSNIYKSLSHLIMEQHHVKL